MLCGELLKAVARPRMVLSSSSGSSDLLVNRSTSFEICSPLQVLVAFDLTARVALVEDV